MMELFEFLKHLCVFGCQVFDLFYELVPTVRPLDLMLSVLGQLWHLCLAFTDVGL